MSDILSRQEQLHLQKYDNLFIIGCGGIGSWVSLFSGLCGCFNHIYIWDPDKIEDTNLNRTPFTEFDIGYYKVDAVNKLIDQRRISQYRHKYYNDDFELKVNIFREKFTAEEYNKKIKHMDDEDSIVIDCRDGIYDDIKLFRCKVFKVNYDGLSITVDGNPKERTIWGQRQGTYNIIPSFICPSVFAANFIVNEICTNPVENQFNDLMTFDSKNMLTIIQRGAI